MLRSDRIFFLSLGRLGILLTPCGYPYSILAAVSPDPNRCHGREVLGTSLKNAPRTMGGGKWEGGNGQELALLTGHFHYLTDSQKSVSSLQSCAYYPQMEVFANPSE